MNRVVFAGLSAAVSDTTADMTAHLGPVRLSRGPGTQDADVSDLPAAAALTVARWTPQTQA